LVVGNGNLLDVLILLLELLGNIFLDSHTSFQKGKHVPVCGNTYLMLQESRFRDFFEFHGSWDTHFGIFEACGAGLPFSEKEIAQELSGSCC
jgi:hypothetical protein